MIFYCKVGFSVLSTILVMQSTLIVLDTFCHHVVVEILLDGSVLGFGGNGCEMVVL